MSDIVERLRAHTPPTIKDLDEAADAIDRLRKLLAATPCTCRWHGTISMPPHPTDHTTRVLCPRCRELGTPPEVTYRHHFA